MKTKRSLSLLAATFLVVVACAKFNFGDNEIDESTNAAAEDLSNLDDSLSGAVAREELDLAMESLDSSINPPPRGTCKSVDFTACASGIRDKVFAECTRGSSTATWSGTARVTFSDTANCKMDTAGKSATRTLFTDMVVTGKRGGTMTVTTGATTTWDGVAIGGGHKVTKTAEGYDFEILGINRKITLGETELANVSRKTTSTVKVTGTTRATRVVNGGEIVTYHNKKEFNVAWVPANVTWEATCRCPVSGSMTGTLTGSQTGSATIEFTGCGTATMTKDGDSEDITLDSCESAS